MVTSVRNCSRSQRRLRAFPESVGCFPVMSSWPNYITGPFHKRGVWNSAQHRTFPRCGRCSINADTADGTNLRVWTHQTPAPGWGPSMDPGSQELRLQRAGVLLNNIHRDVGVSGTTGTRERRGWHRLNGRLTGGDTLVVVAIDRIGRTWRIRSSLLGCRLFLNAPAGVRRDIRFHGRSIEQQTSATNVRALPEVHATRKPIAARPTTTAIPSVPPFSAVEIRRQIPQSFRRP